MRSCNAYASASGVLFVSILLCLCQFPIGCNTRLPGQPGAGGATADDPAGSPGGQAGGDAAQTDDTETPNSNDDAGDLPGPNTEPDAEPGTDAPTAAAGEGRTVRVGEVVTFDAAGSFDNDGVIVSFTWDFGDGTTDEGEQVQHAFARAGVFDVLLTVVDDEGAEDTATVVVTVEALAEFTLTVNVEPPDAAQVALDPPGGVYESGDTVTITVEPAAGYAFTELSGDVSAAEQPIDIVMDADKSVTVVLTPAEVHVDVVADPEDGGQVSLDPPGNVYDYGTTLHVEAEANAGFVFEVFTDETGAVTSRSPTFDLVLEQDVSLVALFEPVVPPPPPPTHTVSVEVTPPEGGTVTLNPPGGSYPQGTAVTLTATPAAGYAFIGYAGDAGGLQPVTTIAVNTDIAVTAEFVWTPAIGNPGNLLVTGFVGGNVTEFDRFDGANLGELVPAASSGLSFAGGIDIGPGGDLFVVDVGIQSDTRVVRYDAHTGALLGTFIQGPGAIGFLTIRFGPNGNLFVANNDANVIEAYDGDSGAFLRAIVEPGSQDLDNPVGMRFGPASNLFVVSKDSNRILEYNVVTGDFVGTVSDLATYGFSVPVDLVFGPDDALYVSTSGQERVARVDVATGMASVFVAAGAGGLDSPGGLAFHPDTGNLLVVSQGTNSVLEYDGASGNFVGEFAAGSEGDSLFFLEFRQR